MSFQDNFRIVIGSAISIPELSAPDAAGSRILSFMTRPYGWKYGRGEQPRATTVASALTLAAHLMRLGAGKTGAFLTEDGGIVVTGYFEAWTSEILCDRSGSFELAVEKEDNEKECEKAANIQEAVGLLTRQVLQWGEKKHSSEFFTLTTLTSFGGDFKVGQFNERLETVSYLSSAYSALATAAVQSATTFVSNTQTLPVSHQFIGNLRRMSYLPMPDSFKRLKTGMNVIILSAA